MIQIALPNKGSLSEDAIALVKDAGYHCKRYGRELSLTDVENGIDIDKIMLEIKCLPEYETQLSLQSNVSGDGSEGILINTTAPPVVNSSGNNIISESNGSVNITASHITATGSLSFPGLSPTVASIALGG